MKKRVIAAIMLAALTFCGCSKVGIAPGSEDAVTQGEEGASNEVAGSESSGAGDDLEVNKAHENDVVIGNGSFFVSINGKIYFRRYDENMFSDSNPNKQYVMLGMGDLETSITDKSEICIYDPATKNVEVFMEDDGYGELYYDRGFFYLEKYDNDNYKNTIYRVNIDTKEVDHSKDINGDLLGMDEKTGAFVVNAYIDTEESNHNSLTVYKDGKDIMSKDTFDYFSEVRFIDGKLYYCIDGDEEDTFFEYDPDANKEVCLGKAVPKKDTDNEFLLNWQIKDVLKDKENIYIRYSDYEGSGSFYNGGMIFSAKEGTENSIEVLYDDKSDVVADDGNLYIASDGQVKVDDLKGKYSFGLEYYGDTAEKKEYAPFIYYEDKDNFKTVVKDFIKCRTENSGVWSEVPNNAVTEIEDNVYMMFPLYVRYDIDDVGWRPNYRMLKMKYLEITGSGEVNVIDDISTTENYIDVEASYANDILSAKCVGVPIGDNGENKAGEEIIGENTFEFNLADNVEYVEGDATKTKADFENYIKGGGKRLRLYFDDNGDVSKMIKLS